MLDESNGRSRTNFAVSNIYDTVTAICKLELGYHARACTQMSWLFWYHNILDTILCYKTKTAQTRTVEYHMISLYVSSIIKARYKIKLAENWFMIQIFNDVLRIAGFFFFVKHFKAMYRTVQIVTAFIVVLCIISFLFHRDLLIEWETFEE